MSEFTPVIGDIALGYTDRAESVCGTPHFTALAEFDRWLAAHDREVKAEALRVASAQCSNVAFGSNADVAECARHGEWEEE